MFKKSLTWILLMALVMGVIALPDSIKAKFPADPVSAWLKEQKITLGLDLQGGTQLDYRIDLRNAETKNSDEDKDNDVKIRDIIEGVRTTLERRVNNLGVSEPQIYTSTIAGEEHIIVELAGIKDIDEAKAVVGKTIQLEFKEPKTEPDPKEAEVIRREAQDALQKALDSKTNFEVLGENVKTSDGKIDFKGNQKQFASNIPQHVKDVVLKLKPGEVHRKLVEAALPSLNPFDQSIVDKTFLSVVQLVSKEMKDRTAKSTDDFLEVAKKLSKDKTLELKGKITNDFRPAEVDALQIASEGGLTGIIDVDGQEWRVYKVIKKEKSDTITAVQASHILIAYKGAERAGSAITRSKEDAKKLAERALKEAQRRPSDFAALAEEYSDDEASAAKGGDLGFFGHGTMAKPFEDVAFALPAGALNGNIVETQFGFHIIQVTAKDYEALLDVQRIAMDKTDENKKTLETAMKRVSEGYDVTKQEEELTWNEIVFDISPDPWKSTGLDGAHFKFATVVYDQLGTPQVSIKFDDEGGKMFEDLTGRLVGQRLAIFVGGELISAPNVNEKIPGGNAVITGNFSIPEALKLANDLNTGAIDAPIILSGQYTISATLGENALKVSLFAGIIGFAALVLFMLFYYRLLGLFAILALCIYSIIIIFILKTTSIVMTLAGIAGIILSIGMAVDANILIFERTREELNSGKNFSASIAAGFERAWSSIKDSNVSSLITCAILWFFGNSIIRGFALMLALGILVSMFTAITVTRNFLKTLTGTAISKNRVLLGAKTLKIVNQ